MKRSRLFYRCWQALLSVALLIATVRVATPQPQGHLIFTSTEPSGMFITDTTGQLICAFEDASSLSRSPDRQTLAFTRRLNTSDSTRGIFIMPLYEGTGEAQLISDAASVTTIPVWSPDGNQIAFIRKQPGTSGRYPTRLSDVMVMNADGSDLQRIGGGIIDIYNYDLIWSPDGREVFFWGWQDGANVGLHRVDVATRETEFIPDQYLDNPHWTRTALSPDGTKRVITEKRADGTFVKLLRDETTGETRFLTDHAPTWNPTWSPDGKFLAYTAYTYSPENKFAPFSQQVIVDAQGRIVRRFDSGRVSNTVWVDLESSPLVENCPKAA